MRRVSKFSRALAAARLIWRVLTPPLARLIILLLCIGIAGAGLVGCGSGNGEKLGEIKEIMLDTRTGAVAYAVLSFGGLLGLGDKLFAVPWSALTLNISRKCFMLNVDRERLKMAPGFDKDRWPDMADKTWASEVHNYYQVKPYFH